MSSESTDRPLEPEMIGSYWVLPTLEDQADAQVRLHVSIAVSPEDGLKGDDIRVRLSAGAEELRQSEGPERSRPLPVINSHGTTAFAQYTFANPDGLVPTAVSVTLDKETRVFPLGAPPSA